MFPPPPVPAPFVPEPSDSGWPSWAHPLPGNPDFPDQPSGHEIDVKAGDVIKVDRARFRLERDKERSSEETEVINVVDKV